MENIIVTVARQYGSGGRTIGKMFAGRHGIPVYGKDILRKASDESGINEALFGQVDEKLTNGSIFKMGRRGPKSLEVLPPSSPDYTSPQNLFNIQAKMIRDLASQGSCVFIGRCADYVLADNPNVVSVFVHASEEFNLEMSKEYGVSLPDAELVKYIAKTDKYRANFYKYYTGREWNDARNYDLCLNSGKLGFEKCVDEIDAYIRVRFGEVF